MNKNKTLLEQYHKYMMPVLDFREIVLTKGVGSYVWDVDGNGYLDLNSGQFCSVFGHSDPGLSLHLNSISTRLQDTDTATLSVPVLHAAKLMHEISGEMDGRILFLSTGAEANECCLKYAKHLKEKSGVIAFDQGYHGLTHGTAGYSMSRDRIRPVLPHSYTVKTPCTYHSDQPSVKECLEEFSTLLENNHEDIAAAIFEPIVSGGGFYFPPKAYFQGVRELCDRYGIFLIFDECQTGMGRTGSWFYFQQLDCVPDFVVCAKAIGLGYPVSCIIANGNTVSQDRFIMQHFSSHQNEPFSGELVSYGIQRIIDENLLSSNEALGTYLLGCLHRLCETHTSVMNPRGIGLMCAFDLCFSELTTDAEAKIKGEEFCNSALNSGLLLQHCNNGRTIRLLPNYMITKEDIDRLYETLNNLFTKEEAAVSLGDNNELY